ncbi:COG4280 domain-containing protein [Nonomuraea sp. NPDC049028]|uniref:COG4280 domain-containing protein n=1 Tax=Nonomuraea sp. NPDC049028 TaxID=3364348 RepID=UPI00370FC9A1
MNAAAWGLGAAVLLASIVEMVEALTIVMAMGVTRSWRSTLAGVAAALVALAAFTALAGYALTTWLPAAALQLAIGGLLLIFGLQWLRKAILRSSGRKAMHDEDQIFAEEVAAAESAGAVRARGLDWFSFMISFKGVFLEGVEVVFIVITFGLSAGNMPVAIGAAGIGVLLVLAVGIAIRGPLSKVPENTMKYGVGLLLAAFGTFWSVEGLGIFTGSRQSLEWPGADLAIPVLIAAWFGLSRLMIHALRRPAVPSTSV